MIIDSHQHFWKYNPVRDSWIDDSMEVIIRDFLPQDLQPILEANNVDGCIAVQADQSEEETEFLLQCAAKNSFIKGVVGWLDLRASNIEARIMHYAKNSLFKGVRHIVQAESDDKFMLKPNFLNGIEKLEKYGLVYDILIHQEQLEQAIALVEKYPNQKFVLDHIAKPKISEGLSSTWEKHIRHLALSSNVACKISGMVTEADLKNWKTSDFIPFLDVVFEAFSAERVLYGSDWPVCLLAADYNQQFNLVKSYISQLSKEEKAKVLAKNAISLYNL